MPPEDAFKDAEYRAGIKTLQQQLSSLKSRFTKLENRLRDVEAQDFQSQINSLSERVSAQDGALLEARRYMAGLQVAAVWSWFVEFADKPMVWSSTKEAAVKHIHGIRSRIRLEIKTSQHPEKVADEFEDAANRELIKLGLKPDQIDRG